jgi:hypothetical protein
MPAVCCASTADTRTTTPRRTTPPTVSSHSPFPSGTLLHESDLTEKLRRVARLFHDETFAIHRSRDVHQFVDHEAADPFLPQIRRDEEIVEPDRVAGLARLRDGNEVADQFSDGAR